jgi:hypothetical protein
MWKYSSTTTEEDEKPNALAVRYRHVYANNPDTKSSAFAIQTSTDAVYDMGQKISTLAWQTVAELLNDCNVGVRIASAGDNKTHRLPADGKLVETFVQKVADAFDKTALTKQILIVCFGGTRAILVEPPKKGSKGWGEWFAEMIARKKFPDEPVVLSPSFLNISAVPDQKTGLLAKLEIQHLQLLPGVSVTVDNMKQAVAKKEYRLKNAPKPDPVTPAPPPRTVAGIPKGWKVDLPSYLRQYTQVMPMLQSELLSAEHVETLYRNYQKIHK